MKSSSPAAPGVPKPPPESAATAARLLAALPVISCTVAAGGDFVHVGPSVKKALGFSPKNLVGRPYLGLVAEADKAATSAALIAIQQSAEAGSFSNTVIAKDGRPLTIHWLMAWSTADALWYGTGTPQPAPAAATANTNTDGTPSVTPHQLHLLMDSISDGFVMLDTQLRITFWNTTSEQDTGILRQQTLGKSYWDVFPATAGSPLQAAFQRVLHTGMAEKIVHDSASLRDLFQVNVLPCTGGLLVYFTNIGRRQKTEAALHQTLERYEILSTITSDVLWDHNLQTDTFFYNQNFTGQFGYSTNIKNPYAHWKAHIHDADRQRVVAGIEEALTQPHLTKWEAEYRFEKANGSFAFIHDRGKIMRDAGGRALRMIGTMRDVTAKIEKQELLKQNEQRLQALLQSGNDLIAVMSNNYGITYISPNVEEVTGYTAHEWSDMDTLKLIHPDDLPRLLEEMELLSTLKKIALTPYRLLHKNGRYIWLRTIASNHTTDPAIGGIVTNSQNVSQQKKSMEELHLLSLIVMETSNSIMVTGRHGEIMWVNKAFTTLTGYTPEEVVGQSTLKLFAGPGTDAATIQYIIKQRQASQPYHCEIVHRTKSGHNICTEMNGQPIFDEAGAVKQYFSVCTDITERKNAEEATRLSKERYRQLFFQSPIPQWVFKADTLAFAEVNNAAVNLYGYTEEEFLGMTILDIRPTSERDTIKNIVRSFSDNNGTRYQARTVHQTKDGRLLHIQISTHGVQLPGGLHVFAVCDNVTERLHLEEALGKEKLLSQQAIARAIIATQEKERSSIATELHDNVNQILTTAKLYAENTQYFAEQREAFTAKSTELIQSAINEIRTISKQLVMPGIKEIGLEASLHELMETYRKLALFTLDVKTKGLHSLLDDELELTLYRIVQEQLNNIVKYAGAGAVKVELLCTAATVKLLIADNGVGFALTTVTKGLGLNNIQNRAALFGGTVTINTAPGKGCSVEVVFNVEAE